MSPVTTTLTGITVPFVVRVETATINRGIYQHAILHDPTSEPEPTPFSPPKGWNKRLLAQHGAGCPGGWYRQGAAQGVNILTGANMMRLGEGWAIFINTLQHPSNSCNSFLAGETTMMGKEHFIETFGVPLYTLSTGGSGGAYTSEQVADAFPGLFDGIRINAVFPDALSIALSGLDGHLLTHYFSVTESDGFHGRSESSDHWVSRYPSLDRCRKPSTTHRSGSGSRRHPRIQFSGMECRGSGGTPLSPDNQPVRRPSDGLRRSPQYLRHKPDHRFCVAAVRQRRSAIRAGGAQW